MMSLLWFYRPEHTDIGRQEEDCSAASMEVFASKHRDHTSVACIEDKCFVMTFNEYCRWDRDLCAPCNMHHAPSTRSYLVPQVHEVLCDGGRRRVSALEHCAREVGRLSQVAATPTLGSQNYQHTDLLTCWPL